MCALEAGEGARNCVKNKKRHESNELFVVQTLRCCAGVCVCVCACVLSYGSTHLLMFARLVLFSPLPLPLLSQIYQQDGRKDTHLRGLAASSSELECVEREKTKEKNPNTDRKRLRDAEREREGEWPAPDTEGPLFVWLVGSEISLHCHGRPPLWRKLQISLFASPVTHTHILTHSYTSTLLALVLLLLLRLSPPILMLSRPLHP